MNAIVFSKNRPMQLDAFLQTVRKYAPFFNVTVIYLSTGEDYTRGYEIVRENYKEITFVKETILKENILSILNRQKSPEYTSFFCDDDLIFRPITPVILEENELCYSLRLGLNTTYCYIYDKSQRFRGEILGHKLKWKYEEGEYDFAYPFSVDGHIFRTKDFIFMIEKIYFNNPHHFENNLAQQKHSRKMMASSREGSLVGVPHNKVHSVFDFRSAGGSAYELNQLFLAGKRINPFKMDYSEIRSVHQELPYVIE